MMDFATFFHELQEYVEGQFQEQAQDAERAYRVGRACTPKQEADLRAGYAALTVPELRRRGGGRGFRPANLNTRRKQELIDLFVAEYGWAGRLLGDGWEERSSQWFRDQHQ